MKRQRILAVVAAVAVVAVVAVALVFRPRPAEVPPTRAAFTRVVMGRTQDEVRSSLGRPTGVTDGFPGDEAWLYPDPESGGRVVVVFTNSKAVSVRVEE